MTPMISTKTHRLRALAKGTPRLAIAIVLAFAGAVPRAPARTLMTREEALALAFPAGVRVTREAIFLTPEQIATAKRESGVDFPDQLVVRYAGSNGTTAYFDSHRVRTEPETVMIVVDATGSISRVDIMAFSEPTDYYPKRRWLDQLLGRKLDEDLALTRAIRPISGASLTGRAIVGASRKILAIHRALGAGPRK